MDWVIIASQTAARIFRRKPYGAALELVEQLENPKGRLRKNDINSDKPGRGFSPADAQRHGYMSPVSPDQQAAMVFARQIADRLEAGRNVHSYDDLILIADPVMLGLIRDSLSENTRQRVREAVNKNLSSLSVHELLKRLRPLFNQVDRNRPLRAG